MTQPLIFGEVLFDHFSSGNRVLGGAPLNVAWNLHGFGLAPSFVSAVGDDDAGREAQRRLRNWGMDVSHVQVCNGRPTGYVQVLQGHREPTYEIPDNQAYDEIEYPDAEVSTAHFSLLYLGSLTYRHATSRHTMQQLMERDLPRFVDVNLRRPWYDRTAIDELLQHATWIKLNERELSYLAQQDVGFTDAQPALKTISRRFHCPNLLVTFGEWGAVALSESEGFVHASAAQAQPFVDSVGAGDAFAATAILGIHLGLVLDPTLAQCGRIRCADVHDSWRHHRKNGTLRSGARRVLAGRFHRINDAPIVSQLVHQLHRAQRLVKRHDRTLQKSRTQASVHLFDFIGESVAIVRKDVRFWIVPEPMNGDLRRMMKRSIHVNMSAAAGKESIMRFVSPRSTGQLGRNSTFVIQHHRVQLVNAGGSDLGRPRYRIGKTTKIRR